MEVMGLPTVGQPSDQLGLAQGLEQDLGGFGMRWGEVGGWEMRKGVPLTSPPIW